MTSATECAMTSRPRLLVFEQRMMGDALMSFPFIRSALSRFDVHVACAPNTANVFALLLPSDRIHPWLPPWVQPDARNKSMRRPRNGLKAYLSELKKLAPDTAVSVWSDSRVHYLMARCGARARIGFPMKSGNYYGGLLSWRKPVLCAGKLVGLVGSLLNGAPQLTLPLFKKSSEQHHIESWRQLADALSLPWDESTPWFTPHRVELPTEITATISRARQENRPVWLVHAGARVSLQRWPVSHFAEMIEEVLVPAGAEVILVDSPEVKWPEALRSKFETADFGNIEQLITLFDSCDGLLCNDTGVSHLAGALGKSVLTVFLTSNPNWYAPRGPHSHWVANTSSIRFPSIDEHINPRHPANPPDLRPRVRAALHELLSEPKKQSATALYSNRASLPLRVLIDAHMIGERETGNETYITHLIQALRALDTNLELIIACAHRDKTFTALGPPDDKCRYHQVSTSPWRRLGWELSNLAQREQADVIHVTYIGPLRTPCPLVTSIHDVSYKVEPSWFSPRDRRVLGMGIGRTVRYAKRIITISEHSKSEIIEKLHVPADKITVALLAAAANYVRQPESVRSSYSPQALGINTPFVLAVGNLQPRKNLLRLIDGYARMTHAHPERNEQLVLVGKAQWRETELPKLIADLGITDRVIFTGYVSDEELVSLYNHAALFAYPSLYEGFGLPVLEAMACGAPVLTSTAASIPEVAGDAAFYVDPTDTDAIAGGLLTILQDPTMQERLRKLGLEQARRFTWRTTAEATLDMYRRALTGE